MIVPRKYTDVLETAHELYRLHPAEIDYSLLARVLQEVLDCPVCIFSEVVLSEGGALGLGWPATEFDSSELTELTRRNMRRHPLIRHYLDTTDRQPLAVSDLMSLRQWKSSAVGSDIYEAVHFHDHLAIPLDSPAGAMRSFALGREDHPFNPQERQLVLALHPLLVAMDKKAQRVLRSAPESLTTREVQILHLVRSGFTSRQIGTKLQVSSRTVEKHLQSAYQKLQVTNRIDALNRLDDIEQGRWTAAAPEPGPVQ